MDTKNTPSCSYCNDAKTVDKDGNPGGEFPCPECGTSRMRYTVLVLEGTTSEDLAMYFSRVEPSYHSIDVPGALRPVVMVEFVPLNGHVYKVGNPTRVPLDRVISVTTEETV